MKRMFAGIVVLLTSVMMGLVAWAQEPPASKGSTNRAGFENQTFFKDVTVGPESFEAPREVKVLPIFFVPKGEKAPSTAQSKRLMQHLTWSQKRYRELLPDRETFVITEKTPQIYWASRPLDYYQKQTEDAAPQIVGELLPDLNCNRYNCPYILLVVMMNPKTEFPNPGGRSLNGGFNTGGGILELSSLTLDQNAWFQSTLQHELGHSFGLPHVDVYGYDMKSGDSLMSYNPQHHTNLMTPSKTPGKLIPEDYRGLALNTRVFPRLRFDPDKQVPPGYTLSERIVPLGPMTIPDQPVAVKVTTNSGEDFGSKVGNIVQGQIASSRKTGKVTFNSKTMWQSAPTTATQGWATIEVTFPADVELSRLLIHSQHSGEYHAAQAVRIAVRNNDGQFTTVIESELKSVDEAVAFPKTKGSVWQFGFHAGPSGMVVLRGLQFFSDSDELFPPLVPLLDQR